MSPRQFKIRSIARGRYTVYLKKAKEFFETMGSALDMGYWNAAGLNAVHCAIASTDALLVYYAGLRSASETHGDAVELLRLHVRDNEVSSKAITLGKILSVKNLIAYEDREYTQPEARELAKLTLRFFDWANEKLKRL